MITQYAFGGVHAIGYCGRCGRPLSNPTSLKFGIGPICRGHSHMQEDNVKRERNVIDWSAWGSRFDYQGYHGCDSHCWIKINGNVVIATEAWDNEGTSVTNMAEDIATTICKQHGIPLDKVVWIEHYIDDEYQGPKHRFDIVNFDIMDEPRWGMIEDGSKYLRHPHWAFLPNEKAQEFFGEPLAITVQQAENAE